LPQPRFELIPGGFAVTVFSEIGQLEESKTDLMGTEKGTERENVPENRENLIVELIKQKETIKLKQKSLLRRIGPAKGGHWEIANKTGKNSEA
jgi:hypothetical protein